MLGFVMQAICAEIQAQKMFQEYLDSLPEEERQKVIDAREKQRQAAKAERERQEYLEAIKPHSLWSFLGLGRK